MATVRANDAAVTVDLKWWERIFAAGRPRLVVPTGVIARASVVDQPTRWTATPGGRSGIVVTGVLKIGRWGLGTGMRYFVSTRRNRPALRLELTHEGADLTGYDVVLVSTADAAALADALTSGSRTPETGSSEPASTSGSPGNADVHH
ncbi:hypothetical protein ACQPXM_36570 [Kribbella sp. CA-253562]|uniref:hypothetical protein n=1 Tax=Kribbella sp. CA-253562 TaxID=3239942 RepID=UPI003D8C79EE